MANELVLPEGFGPISTVFANLPATSELGDGIQASFAIMSYKGKTWSIKYQGVSKPLMRKEEPDTPQAAIEVVIVKAASVISKIFYKDGYTDGMDKPPDCFSTNGLTPDKASPIPQCPTCAACPNNAWGSRVTDAGKASKACQDSKRLAIVPLNNLSNDILGGPMLLRVPPASLKDLKSFGDNLTKMGYNPYTIGVRIMFDYKEAFPKFVFGAIRPLNDDEAAVVLELREDLRVDRILNVPIEQVTHEPDATTVASPLFEQAPTAAQAQEAAANVTAAATAAAAAAIAAAQAGVTTAATPSPVVPSATAEAEAKLAQLKELQAALAKKAQLEELHKQALAKAAKAAAIQAAKDKAEEERRKAAEAAAVQAAKEAEANPMSEIEKQIAALQAQLAGTTAPASANGAGVAAVSTSMISSGEERVNPDDAPEADLIVDGQVRDAAGVPVDFDDMLAKILPKPPAAA